MKARGAEALCRASRRAAPAPRRGGSPAIAAPVSVARRWVEDDEIRDLGTEDVHPPPARLGQN
ncbi:hypothetical protein BE21_43255 [Sorangium cellulosum]|uniref:Uncharacterized protein n=1 Tax=Sorangium cellulosum TaxID=56 RepID=A0A150TK21_SORCE|nr:hypothetical protein BE21_43255 [Sorangium cellulosum]